MWFIRRAIEIWRKDGFRPLLRSILSFAQAKYWRIKFACRHWYYKVQYGSAAPRPWRLLYVNPNEIDAMVVNTPSIPIRVTGTKIVGGSWDENVIDLKFMSQRELRQQISQPGVTPLSNYGFFISIRNHFEEGVPWSETGFYQYKVESEESGFYNSLEEIKQRLSELDELYDDMKINGYKTQREMLRDCDDNPPLGLPSQENPEYHEVMIAIGRSGELLFVDGRHRLAVAQLLEIDEIPVRVVARHTYWQEIRNHAVDGNLPRNINNDHPDLQKF